MTTNYSIDKLSTQNQISLVSGSVNSVAIDKLDSRRHIVALNQGSSFTLKVGVMSGGTVMYGPAILVSTTTSAVAVAALDANTFVLVKSSGSSTGNAVAYSCTVSADVVITCGTPTVFFDTGWAGGPPIISVAPLGATNFVIGYASSTNSNMQSLNTVVGAVSGSTITSFGTPQSVGAGAISLGNISVAAIAGTTTKFAVAYNDSTTGVADTNNRGKVVIGNTSGTTITLGSPEIFFMATTSVNFKIISPTLNQFVIFGAGNTNSSDMFATFGNITGQTTLATTTTVIGKPVSTFTPLNVSLLDSTHILVQNSKDIRVVEVNSSGISYVNSIQTLNTSAIQATYNATWAVWGQTATSGIAILGSALPEIIGVPITFDNNAFYYQPKAITLMATGNDIEAAGFLGVGTQNPLYALHVMSSAATVAGFSNSAGGTCTINPTATALSCSSDVRLKTNITTIASSTEMLRKLRGVNFSWKNDETGAKRIGFIAQEVQAVIPELVSEDAGGMLAVNYLDFAPVLVNAWNDLDVRTTELEFALASSTASTTASLVRISALEDLIASSSVFTLTATSTATSSPFMATLLDALANVFANVTTYFKDMIVQALTIGQADKPTGITFYDSVTGEPYCLKVTNGVQVTTLGVCVAGSIATSTPLESTGSSNSDSNGASSTPSSIPLETGSDSGSVVSNGTTTPITTDTTASTTPAVIDTTASTTPITTDTTATTTSTTTDASTTTPII